MRKLIIVLIVIALIAGLVFAAPAIIDFMNWMGNINGSYSNPKQAAQR